MTIALAGLAGGGCGGGDVGDAPVARCYPEGACPESMFATGIKATLGDPAAGARIFAANCARCHGAEGVGIADARHIDLGSAAWQASMRDAAIVATVRAGRGTAMPAFTFTEQELRDLLAHVRGLVRTGKPLPGTATPPPDAKRGGY